MRFRHFQGAACVCVLAAGFSLLAADVEESPGPGEHGPTRQSLQWFDTVGAGKAVRIVNHHGDVHVRFGGYEAKIEILATLQNLSPPAPDPRVDRVTTEGGLNVSVSMPAPQGPSPLPADDDRGRADLVLFVPQGRPVVVETRSGKVAVKGLQGDLTISTVTGDVQVAKVEGSVRVKSARGAISATLQSGVTDDVQTFATETGGIEVYLWEDANLDARLATSGTITTDFSLEIEHRRFEEPGKHASARIGRGGPELSLRSKRGDLRLLRLPKHFKRDD